MCRLALIVIVVTRVKDGEIMVRVIATLIFFKTVLFSRKEEWTRRKET